MTIRCIAYYRLLTRLIRMGHSGMERTIRARARSLGMEEFIHRWRVFRGTEVARQPELAAHQVQHALVLVESLRVEAGLHLRAEQHHGHVTAAVTIVVVP